MKIWLAILLLPFTALAAAPTDQLLLSPELPSPDSLSKVAHVDQRALHADMETLVRTMRNGYGGYRILSQQLESETFPALLALNMPGASTEQVCEAVGKILDRVPDNHISVQNRDISGSCGKSSLRGATVGSNIKQDGDGPWGYFEKPIRGAKIPVIAVTRMELRNSQGWAGFLEKAREIYQTAPALIVDLRGNGGGDDSKPLEFAKIFYGLDGQNGTIKAPSQIVRRSTPDALAMFANSFASMLLYDKFRGIPEKPHVRAMYEQYMNHYQQSLRGMVRAQQIFDLQPLPLDPSRMFRGPIRILVDGKCASSCESMVDFFERHINAKTVGENTGGYVHFGNIGTLWLQNSRLYIGLAIQAEVFSDRRFVEKVGYAPAIRVPPGQDAMTTALDDIHRILTGN